MLYQRMLISQLSLDSPLRDGTEKRGRKEIKTILSDVRKHFFIDSQNQDGLNLKILPENLNSPTQR